jgi:outer membrane protein OmpA-like peptidoglycan-associated protein
VISTSLTLAAAIFTACATAAAAQGTAPGGGPATTGLPSRTTTAVTYEARRTTKVDLIGTPLLPRARGEAQIKTEASGPVRIKAKVRGMSQASQFGPEYLTFVTWAIPPRGLAKNLGELRLEDGEAEIEATSDVQTFALIITAEPYYAVTTPSDVVVLENAVREETRGRTSLAKLQYEIVSRGAYTAGASRYVLPQPGRREPPDVQQARNAVAIAQIAQAGRLAPDGLATAQRLLGQVEGLIASRGSTRDIISQSRAAVQVAEEARLQSIARRVAEEAEAVRAAAAASEWAAREAGERADQQAVARRAAEEDRERAEEKRERAEEERDRAEQVSQQNARERERAEQAKREADLARADAEAQAARAEALRAQAEQDRVALRETLRRQFSDILDTRDTTRGLIVNVGDLLFETGQYELRPSAREKLARFAGIVLPYQGLSVQVEGFTDSTGSDALNERLSRQRADAVSRFLIGQGLAPERLRARGYGPADPIASNDTPEGRQRNRRVELVVSGEMIGTPIGTPNERPVGTTGRER